MPGLPDLRDCNFFPPLSLLPHDNGLPESEYYTLSASRSIYRDLFMPNDNYTTLQRRKHWCLLAEIVELNFWPFRPMYKVKDITGQTFLAAFHFDDRTLFPNVEKEATVGSTICVMYAEFHYFADGQIGVRLEEPSSVKILPLGLEELAAMGESCRRTWNSTDVSQSCTVCGHPSSKRCSLCSVAAYCTKECQTQDWKAKHKNECPKIKSVSRQLKSWNQFGWERYDIHRGFEDFV